MLFSNQFTYWGKTCEKESFLKESPLFKGIIPEGEEKEGIARHVRGYMVKRDFCYIDEICKKNSWFPKEGEAKLLSESIGDEKSGSCSGCQDTRACS